MIITSLTKNKKVPISADEVKSKAEQIAQVLQMNCHICAHPYNTVDQLPTVVCAQEHTYCSRCVDSLLSQHSQRGARCPACRVLISKKTIHTNKTILRLCDAVPRLLQKYIEVQREKIELEQKFSKAMIEVEKKKIYQEVYQNKENSNKNSNQRDEFSGLPFLHANQFSKRSSKMNIHSFVAQRKRIASTAERQLSNIKAEQVSLTKRLL